MNYKSGDSISDVIRGIEKYVKNLEIATLTTFVIVISVLVMMGCQLRENRNQIILMQEHIEKSESGVAK
jgi:hypothetical protein